MANIQITIEIGDNKSVLAVSKTAYDLFLSAVEIGFENAREGASGDPAIDEADELLTVMRGQYLDEEGSAISAPAS